jgi:hypothetical protein
MELRKVRIVKGATSLTFFIPNECSTKANLSDFILVLPAATVESSTEFLNTSINQVSDLDDCFYPSQLCTQNVPLLTWYNNQE